jgi:hypothetical protein
MPLRFPSLRQSAVRRLLVLVAFGWQLLLAPPISADAMRTFVKRGTPYADVKFDLVSAIEGKGLKIGVVGDLADMLDRTHADVGSGTARIYIAAHYIQFCSAKLAHALTAANPANLGYCPFLMFIYEAVATPGEVVIGYRPLIGQGSAATSATLAEVTTLLDDIATEATK